MTGVWLTSRWLVQCLLGAAQIVSEAQACCLVRIERNETGPSTCGPSTVLRRAEVAGARPTVRRVVPRDGAGRPPARSAPAPPQHQPCALSERPEPPGAFARVSRRLEAEERALEQDPVRGVQAAPRPTGRREQNKEETRRRIVAAGRQLFSTQGFEATTTGAVAREAGIGAGTLYNYVRGKEDLLVAVFREDVDDEWDQAFAVVDAAAPVLEQVLDVFEHVSRFHEEEPELSRAFFRDLHFVSPSVSAGVDVFMRSVYDRLEIMLRSAQDGGSLLADVPVRPLSRNLFSLWYVTMQRRHAGGSDLNDTLRRLRRAFEVALWNMVPAPVSRSGRQARRPRR